MKRWAIWSFIGAYLSVMSWGIVSHATYYRVTAHPLMYFIVWDMFCGWSAYSTRMEILAEGESGNVYRLAPGPWGEFHPYGKLERRHYDTTGSVGNRIALNTLRHTKHEPISRIFVVEEAWAKKYNLPDHIWNRRYDAPKDPQHYYQVRSIHDGNGMAIQRYTNWIDHQAWLTVANSPKIKSEYNKSLGFYRPFPAMRLSKGQVDALAATAFEQMDLSVEDDSPGRVMPPPSAQ